MRNTYFFFLSASSLPQLQSNIISADSSHESICDITGSKSVRDISGHKLRTGIDYYILPVIRGKGGGLALGSKLNGTQCPLDVVQDQPEISDGLPLTFTPVDPKKKKIRISTDLNIKFSGLTICVQSMVWQLADIDESTGQRFIKTSGVEGNPGPETVENWFKIERDGDGDYKLVFCPSVCTACIVTCRDIGIYVGEDGVGRLALTDGTAFKVMFKKAYSAVSED
ncbi:Proteinase inhibitor I3 [Macleaya cordata]|uniref:Proteinase inhibitor I3 n=1 Tax=Macleaya cordata TaxID=56857 RepID=A0A200QJU9_MACCD|nr:Proteinase inhibitor I3 [Macleaya cordata]